MLIKTLLKTFGMEKKYNKLRQMHITGDFPKGHKCVEKCDQVKLFEYLKKNKN